MESMPLPIFHLRMRREDEDGTDMCSAPTVCFCQVQSLHFVVVVASKNTSKNCWSVFRRMTIVTTQDDLMNQTSEKRGCGCGGDGLAGPSSSSVEYYCLLWIKLQRVPDQSCSLLLSIFATRERERVTITQRLFCSCIVRDWGRRFFLITECMENWWPWQQWRRAWKKKKAAWTSSCWQMAGVLPMKRRE